MAKTKISEFSATPGNNTDIDGINIAEGCAPSGINDAIRELMAQLKDWQAGTSNDPYVVGSSGSLTLSYGTANGVPYLNGSKVLTSGSSLVFDGTNLGIGTSSPSAKLHTYSATGATYNYVQTGDGSNAGIRLKNSVKEFYLLDNSSGAFDIYDATAAASRLTITSSGNVGIGTSSPTWKTTVVNGSTPRCLQLSQYATNNTDKYSFISAGHYTSSTYTDGFALIGGVGSSGANAVQIGGGIGETLASSVIQFYTAANNTTTVGTEQMRLTSTGLGIGTSSPSYPLDVAGAIRGNSWIGRANSSAPTADAFVYRPADNSLGFGTANTEQARITSTGLFQFNSGYGSVATAYGCRAWVNFNGTGTVAIRASGNVSSITDNGTGEYTVNFTTAMPDTNYSVSATARVVGDAGCVVPLPDSTNTTSAYRIASRATPQGASTDAAHVYFQVFR